MSTTVAIAQEFTPDMGTEDLLDHSLRMKKELLTAFSLYAMETFADSMVA